jgi:hypothetical protein
MQACGCHEILISRILKYSNELFDSNRVFDYNTSEGFVLLLTFDQDIEFLVNSPCVTQFFHDIILSNFDLKLSADKGHS